MTDLVTSKKRLDKTLEWLATEPETSLIGLIKDTFGLKTTAAYGLLRKAKQQYYMDVEIPSYHVNVIETMHLIDRLVEKDTVSAISNAIKHRMALLGLNYRVGNQTIIIPSQNSLPVVNEVDDFIDNPDKLEAFLQTKESTDNE